MMPKIIIKDGEEMIVDFMSNRRYPPDEEGFILGHMRAAEKQAEEGAATKKVAEPQSEIPNFLRTN